MYLIYFQVPSDNSIREEFFGLVKELCADGRVRLEEGGMLFNIYDEEWYQVARLSYVYRLNVAVRDIYYPNNKTLTYTTKKEEIVS